MVGILALVAGIAALVALELGDEGVRRFWVEHPITTALFSAALVVLVTAAIVDDVLRRREERELAPVITALAHVIELEAQGLGRAMSVWENARDAAAAGTVAELVRDFRLVVTATAPVLATYPSAKHLLFDAFAYADAVRQEMRGTTAAESHRTLLRSVEARCAEARTASVHSAQPRAMRAWEPGERGKGVLDRRDPSSMAIVAMPVYHADILRAHKVPYPSDHVVLFDVGPDGRFTVHGPCEEGDSRLIRQCDPRLSPEEQGWTFG